MRETRNWNDILLRRTDRMHQLLEANAPDHFILNEARLILLAEAHGKLRLMMWNLVKRELQAFWFAIKSDLGAIQLMKHGWSKSCATAIYAGEPESMHTKGKCNCMAEAQRMAQEGWL